MHHPPDAQKGLIIDVFHWVMHILINWIWIKGTVLGLPNVLKMNNIKVKKISQHMYFWNLLYSECSIVTAGTSSWTESSINLSIKCSSTCFGLISPISLRWKVLLCHYFLRKPSYVQQFKSNKLNKGNLRPHTLESDWFTIQKLLELKP